MTDHLAEPPRLCANCGHDHTIASPHGNPTVVCPLPWCECALYKEPK